MDKRRDRVTDYAAIVLSVGVSVVFLGLAVYEYLFLDPVGSVSPWLRWVVLLFIILAMLTLFGAEKVSEALNRLGGS